MSRSFRRHHMQRITRNRRHYWGRELSGRNLGVAANTPKPCGCWMCSRQRDLYGMKIQELRQIDAGDAGNE